MSREADDLARRLVATADDPVYRAAVDAATAKMRYHMTHALPCDPRCDRGEKCEARAYERAYAKAASAVKA